MTPAFESGPDSKKIVFIVGAARSGTTWLQYLMQQSPYVASTGNETHLFDTYIKPLVTTWDVSEGRNTGIRRLLAAQEFEAWVNDFVQKCVERIAASRVGGNIVLEKTPPHSFCGPVILRFLPNSYFIHILRDPRAVVLSLRAAANSWGAHWAPGRIRDACEAWRAWVSQARGISMLTPRYCEVFYEQLHGDAPGELKHVFDWLDQPINVDEAQTYAAACSLAKMRKQATEGEAQGKIREPSQFFRRGEIDSWKTELTPTEIAIVERLTAKEMAALGYEPVSGRRARMAAKARLKTYRAADRFAKAVRAGADRLKP